MENVGYCVVKQVLEKAIVLLLLRNLEPLLSRFSVKYLPLQFYHLTATQYSKFLSYLKVFVLNLVSIIKYPAFVLYILCWAVLTMPVCNTVERR